MNNYKIYIMALGLAGMGLTSCTADFLDVESKVDSIGRKAMHTGL